MMKRKNGEYEFRRRRKKMIKKKNGEYDLLRRKKNKELSRRKKRLI